jgi:hypothetical protein
MREQLREQLFGDKGCEIGCASPCKERGQLTQLTVRAEGRLQPNQRQKYIVIFPTGDGLKWKGNL